jgi:pimeloyl-ACP methyl ester carboxylesterase
MSRREHLGRWSDTAAERRFRSIEDELWREAFPTRPALLDVDTSVGRTRAYHWPGTGTPVAFLHGMGATSLMWWECVTRMDGRPVYAIDTIGDVGRSEQREAFRDAAHEAEWLDETLAAVAEATLHLVGASYGGWLALNQAVRSPDRLASICLVEPVGLARFDMGRFLLWGLGVFAGSVMPGPIRRRAAVWTRMPALDDRRVMRMARLGYRKHPFRLPPPEPLTDDQLRAITTPSLILLGERSAVHRATLVAQRVHALMPSAQLDFVADAGHALPVSHAVAIAERITTFLKRTENQS